VSFPSAGSILQIEPHVFTAHRVLTENIMMLLINKTKGSGCKPEPAIGYHKK
jgi:hypothetical protein